MSKIGIPNPLPVTNETGEELNVIVTDESGNGADIIGTVPDELKVHDMGSMKLLGMILAEMQKTNLYLSLMTDICVKNDDVEV